MIFIGSFRNMSMCEKKINEEHQSKSTDYLWYLIIMHLHDLQKTCSEAQYTSDIVRDMMSSPKISCICQASFIYRSSSFSYQVRTRHFWFSFIEGICQFFPDRYRRLHVIWSDYFDLYPTRTDVMTEFSISCAWVFLLCHRFELFSSQKLRQSSPMILEEWHVSRTEIVTI